jgi:hypothetical protein
MVHLAIDGLLRTEVTEAEWSLAGGPLPVLDTHAYVLCAERSNGLLTPDGGPGHWVEIAYGGSCEGSASKFMMEHPSIYFSTVDTSNTVVFGDEDANFTALNVRTSLFDMSGVGAAVVLTELYVPCAADAMLAQMGEVFMYSAGAFYKLERHLALVDNTLANPSNGMAADNTVTSCPSAVSSFINEDTCVRRTSCAAWGTPLGNPSMSSSWSPYSSVNLPLDTTTLLLWYTLSDRYVYYVTGLRLEGNADLSPCVGPSRWRRIQGACTAPTALDATTMATLAAALAASTDTNEYVRDIAGGMDDSECATGTSGGVSVLGAFVDAGGECYEHIHPDEFSVRDFSYWVNAHPGGANAIRQWAVDGSAALQFPTSHQMLRWAGYRQHLGYLGRYGDTVPFSSLPTEDQTVEMATNFGALNVNPSDSVLVCGSPGEVRNQPQLGDHYQFIEESWETSNIARDFPHQQRTAKEMGVINVAFNAVDQLRQRSAWALSQIFTIGTAGTMFQHLTECWLAYYDIFVRNAFGNFRDIVREVAYR